MAIFIVYSDCFTYIYYVYKINEVLLTRIYFTSTIQSLFESKVRCSDLWTRKIRKNEDYPNTKKSQPLSINLQYYIQLWFIGMTLSLKYSYVSFLKFKSKSFPSVFWKSEYSFLPANIKFWQSLALKLPVKLYSLTFAEIWKLLKVKISVMVRDKTRKINIKNYTILSWSIKKKSNTAWAYIGSIITTTFYNQKKSSGVKILNQHFQKSMTNAIILSVPGRFYYDIILKNFKY